MRRIYFTFIRRCHGVSFVLIAFFILHQEYHRNTTFYLQTKLRLLAERYFEPKNIYQRNATSYVQTKMRLLAERYLETKTIDYNETVAKEMFAKEKILCLVLSVNDHLDGPVYVVNTTWGRHCNKILYVMCTERQHKDILNSCQLKETKNHLVSKVRFMFWYAYHYHLDEYKWILKADDDSYVIIENLRFLLSHYNSNNSIYLGYHLKKHVDQGYMSGGAGYVLSRKAVEVLINKGFRTNACAYDGKDEDVEIGNCLQKAGVRPHTSYDMFKRETFHTDNMWEHILGTLPVTLTSYSWNEVLDGPDCCSQFSVSFHHVTPPMMIFLHHMLYRTSVYGINKLDNITHLFQGSRAATV